MAFIRIHETRWINTSLVTEVLDVTDEVWSIEQQERQTIQQLKVFFAGENEPITLGGKARTILLAWLPN